MALQAIGSPQVPPATLGPQLIIYRRWERCHVAAADDTLRAVTKADNMDADSQYATAVTIEAKADAVTYEKDGLTFTRTSTDLFADVAAI